MQRVVLDHMGSAYFDAHSYWQRHNKPMYPALSQSTSCDVAVIGAGIAGITVAFELAERGYRVIVLERERLGLGETGLSSAHLSNVLDEGFTELIRIHGEEGASLAQASHAQAIDHIERLVHSEGIACDFRRLDGFLMLSPQLSEDHLRQELIAAKHCGVRDVELLMKLQLSWLSDRPALRFPHQAQVHPLKYLDGLAEAARKRGVIIHTHTEIMEVTGGQPARLTTSTGHTVHCEHVVVATNSPINNGLSIHGKNAAYRTYCVAFRCPNATPALVWDTDDPYHYVRTTEDAEQTLLLVGGEDHRTGQDTESEHHFENLKDWAREQLGVDQPALAAWSGQVMEPVDGLAFIGRNPHDHDNVFIVTGDSGHGLTHGTIAGLMLPELIAGRHHAWEKLYSPSRLHLKSLGTLIKEASSSTMPYGDWLTHGDVASLNQIDCGEGAILRDGLNKVAVYKDELGRLHACQATCTHLGGVVRWNSAEKTWDCPCHGSRFDRFGQVVNGPAVKALEAVSPPEPGSTIALITLG